MAPRPYRQQLRAESALDTRRRIIDAVIEQLRHAPADPVTLDRVAQLARVARPTIYTTFGSRAGLFDAVGADLLRRAGLADVLAAAEHPDARAGLRATVQAVVTLYASHHDVFRPLNAMARLEPTTMAGAVQRMEHGRAAGMTELCDRLAARHLLRPGLTAAAAADLLCLLTSFESFDLLHTGRGLPVATTAELLADTAERTLCDPPGAAIG